MFRFAPPAGVGGLLLGKNRFVFYGRLFHKPSMHNDLTSLVIHRVKNIAGYPESSAEILLRPTLLENLDLYGDGDVRAMEVRG